MTQNQNSSSPDGHPSDPNHLLPSGLEHDAAHPAAPDHSPVGGGNRQPGLFRRIGGYLANLIDGGAPHQASPDGHDAVDEELRQLAATQKYNDQSRARTASASPRQVPYGTARTAPGEPLQSAGEALTNLKELLWTFDGRSAFTPEGEQLPGSGDMRSIFEHSIKLPPGTRLVIEGIPDGEENGPYPYTTDQPLQRKQLEVQVNPQGYLVGGIAQDGSDRWTWELPNHRRGSMDEAEVPYDARKLDYRDSTSTSHHGVQLVATSAVWKSGPNGYESVGLSVSTPNDDTRVYDDGQATVDVRFERSEHPIEGAPISAYVVHDSWDVVTPAMLGAPELPKR